MKPLPPYSPHLTHWTLDTSIVFLNHGSFGACPRPVLEHQEELRARLEREPVHFLVREYPGLLEGVRAQLAAFLHAAPEDIVFVPNATHGINTVLSALPLEEGDEILVHAQEYRATRNAAEYHALRRGARVIEVDSGFPLEDDGTLIEAFVSRVSPRTRYCLVDHVTSPTAQVFPIAALKHEMDCLGVELIVDGAHAPGMIDLDLAALGVPFYTGNLHKWCCAPKGAAFLFIRSDRQKDFHPLAASHGYSQARSPKIPLHREFDWTGTFDPTAILSVGAALDFISSLFPGGVRELMAHNHALACEGRDLIVAALGTGPLAPAQTLGSMATITLPPEVDLGGDPALETERLYDTLFDEFKIEVPIIRWPTIPGLHLRISAQAYNSLAQYSYLASALTEIRERQG